MSTHRSLKVIDSVYLRMNALKIRIAQSNDNRIPNVSNMIAAMITVGNNHYDELLTELMKEPENES